MSRWEKSCLEWTSHIENVRTEFASSCGSYKNRLHSSARELATNLIERIPLNAALPLRWEPWDLSRCPREHEPGAKRPEGTRGNLSRQHSGFWTSHFQPPPRKAHFFQVAGTQTLEPGSSFREFLRQICFVFPTHGGILRNAWNICIHVNARLLLVMGNVLIFSLLSKLKETFVKEPHQLNFQNVVTDIRACPGMQCHLFLYHQLKIVIAF